MKKNRKFIRNHVLNEGYEASKTFFEKGIGSKLIINNKSYYDLSFSAGSLLLGHQSKIFKKAFQNLINDKITVMAAPNRQAINYSNLLKKIFPHYNKFIFCSTGSEAVMKALRISKAITKKSLIISVTGSWHGSNDKTLFSADKNFNALPISSGLSKYDKSKIKFIPYNNITKSKKILNKYKKRLSCILIEPVQACLPSSDIKKYLRFLKNFSKKNKIILIFDEMITGLRTDGSSVQSIYKIKPDLGTFGKCFGGGTPIGIIGVSNKVEKLFKKQNPRIFLGGTFSANSISTYIGKLTAEYILKNKKKIFNDLKIKSKYFSENLNNFIKQKKLSISIYNFKSMFRIVFTKEQVKNRTQRDFFELKKMKKINLFRKFLFSKKIYYPSNGIIFLSTQTSIKDIDVILKNIKVGLIKYFKNEE